MIHLILRLWVNIETKCMNTSRREKLMLSSQESSLGLLIGFCPFLAVVMLFTQWRTWLMAFIRLRVKIDSVLIRLMLVWSILSITWRKTKESKKMIKSRVKKRSQIKMKKKMRRRSKLRRWKNPMIMAKIRKLRKRLKKRKLRLKQKIIFQRRPKI